MSAPDVVVHTELDGDTHLVGHLWIRESRRGTFGATFQYADSWVEDKGAFAVDPLLSIVSPGPYHKERLFGAIADSAPDRWGRTLMSRAERAGVRAAPGPRHLELVVQDQGQAVDELPVGMAIGAVHASPYQRDMVTLYCPHANDNIP